MFCIHVSAKNVWNLYNISFLKILDNYHLLWKVWRLPNFGLWMKREKFYNLGGGHTCTLVLHAQRVLKFFVHPWNSSKNCIEFRIYPISLSGIWLFELRAHFHASCVRVCLWFCAATVSPQQFIRSNNPKKTRRHWNSNFNATFRPH